jgi:hypothetical protein
MSPTKVLQINPILFSTNKSSNSKTLRREKKSKPISQYKGPNTLRKTLLGKIRDFQKKEEDGNKKEDLIVESSNEPAAFESEFNKSLQFLQELSKQKAKNKTQKERKHKSKSNLNQTKPLPINEIEIKTDAFQKPNTIHPMVHTELPDDLKEHHIMPSFVPLMQPVFQSIKIQQPSITMPLQIPTPIIQPQAPAIPTPMPMPAPMIMPMPTPIIQQPLIQLHAPIPSVVVEAVTKPPPSILKNADSLPYSNLKGGTKPTYKEWLRLTQKTKPTNTNTNTNTIQNVKIKDMISKKPNKKMLNVKTTTRTLKYNLGKHGRTVSVLIKNRNTRKKIKQEHTLLKQKPINEVKDFLRQKNLIKAGTTAPNNVLREMYEQSILTGDVSNNSKDNLIHNFLSDTISKM